MLPIVFYDVFYDSLTRSVEILKSSDREQLSILTLLMKNTSPPEPELNSIAKEFGFPMKSVRDMRQLERRLGEEGFRLKVFSFISGIGGTVASVVGRILRRLMTYSLGSLFCYKGLNGDKYSFQEPNICSITIGKQ